MIKGFNKTLAFIQFLTGKTQEEIAKSIGYSRPYFSQLRHKPDEESDDIQKLLLDKYRRDINEFFGGEANLLEEPAADYDKSVKIVDAEELLVQDSLQIKGMLRVILRNQATLISAQKKIALNKVLEEMTRAVRDETEAEFDEL